MRVFVINQRKKPLMPCTQQKARKLLKSGKAKIYKREPFTIQLLVQTGESKQEINLGVDAGSKFVGLSATTEKKELFSVEYKLRNDIVDLISTRRQNRRTRRNRLRYRQARFQNRKKNKDWLAPSVQHKIDSHINIVNMIHSILPIYKIIVETASFDIQKIQNPEINGKEYQEGNQLGFWNVREYVLFRDNHTCQHCKGKSKDKILNVHHIESRKVGGNSPNNLVTLCETCHNNHHKGRIDLKIKDINDFEDFDSYYIIECKRLDGKSTLNKYYINHGINRFTSGYYSSSYGINGMLAFVVEKIDIHSNMDKIGGFFNCLEINKLYDSNHSNKKLFHLIMDFSSNIK